MYLDSVEMFFSKRVAGKKVTYFAKGEFQFREADFSASTICSSIIEPGNMEREGAHGKHPPFPDDQLQRFAK